VGDKRRHHRDSHADHAVAVARLTGRRAGKPAQREDEKHARDQVSEHRPGRRAAFAAACGIGRGREQKHRHREKRSDEAIHGRTARGERRSMDCRSDCVASQ